MNILSISTVYKNSSKPFCLRFQQGTGKFRHVYFISNKKEVLNKLRSSIQFIFSEQEDDQNLAYVSVTLSDGYGNHWEIKKKKNRLLIMKNNEPQKLTLRQLVDTMNEKPTQMDIGSYHLTQQDDQLLMAPYEQESPEDEINYSFINNEFSKLVKACQNSFNSPVFSKYKNLSYFYENLEPLTLEYAIQQNKLEKLRSFQSELPKSTTIELTQLKNQLQILSKLEQLTDFIFKGTPSLETLNLNIKRASQKLEDNLKFCKLTAPPSYESLPDWNTPLHCLCYLNIIDKIIPQLSSWLETFKKSAKNLNSKNSDFSSLKFSILEKLNLFKTYIHEVEEHSNNEESAQNPLWQKISKFRTKNQDFTLSKERQLMDHVKDLIVWVKGSEPRQDFLSESLETISSFLRESEAKRKSLRTHWVHICKTYKINENIDLHEFTQFSVKYNETIMIAQDIHKMKKDKKERLNKLDHIKELLSQWYEQTGSQKAVSFDNYQIIMSESQNILRYKVEKERQFNELEEHRLRTETNIQLKNDLEEHIEKILYQWNDVLREGGAPKLFEITDPRLHSFFEKCRLITTLAYLKQNLRNIDFSPAFPESWNYEAICFWQPTHLFLDDAKSMKDFLAAMENVPSDTKHILFYEDMEISPQLRSVGMGQITQYFPSHIEDVHIEPTVQEVPKKSPKPQAIVGQNIKTLGGKKVQRDQSRLTNVLSPKARATLDILKGHNLQK